MLDLLLAKNSFNFKYIFSNILDQWYYYVIFFAFLAFIIIFFTLKRPHKYIKFSNVQKVTYLAILIALATIVNALLTIKFTDTIQISLIAVIGFIAGYIFGGSWAFTVCFLGDLIGFIIVPRGVYNPIIGIATGLWGLIPGILFYYFKGNNYLKTCISYGICLIVSSFLLNTIGMWLMFSMPLEGLLLAFPIKILNAGVNLAISLLCMRAINTLKNYFVGRRAYELPSEKKDSEDVDSEEENTIESEPTLSENE